MSLIELTDVKFSYPDGTPALGGISVSFDLGKCYCLQGPNGCGKSTLFRILNGLSFPDSGTYRFDGTEITAEYLKNKNNAHAFHRQIGFIFQNSEVQLFTSSVEDEIAFGPFRRGEEAVCPGGGPCHGAPGADSGRAHCHAR